MSTKLVNVNTHPPEESAVSISIEHFDACLKLLDGEEFDFRKFLELTSYIESYVLYDKVNILKTQRFLAPKPSLTLSPSTLSLVQSNSILTQIDFGMVSGDRVESIIFSFNHELSLIDNSINLGEIFFHALVDEKEFSIPYHIPIEALGRYLDAVQIEKSHQIYSLLFKAYGEMSESLRKEIEELQQFLKTNTVYVPPIMALILDRCSEPANIVELTLEMKEKLRPLRQAFKEYENKFRDSSVSLKDSLTAAKELKRSVEQLRLVEPKNGEYILSEWRDGLSLLPDLDSLESSDTGLTKFFLGKPAEWIANRIKNRKLITLFNLKKEFLNIQEYHQLIKKVFSYDITEQDVQACSHYWASIDRLVQADKRIVARG